MKEAAGPAHPTQRSGLNRTDHTREVEPYEAGPIRKQRTTIRGRTDQHIADDQSEGGAVLIRAAHSKAHARQGNLGRTGRLG
jgi:hypothetical protein